MPAERRLDKPGASPKFAVTPVTIQQAVQEAIEKNLSLLAERYNVTIAEAHVITARLRPNPVLSVGGDPPAAVVVGGLISTLLLTLLALPAVYWLAARKKHLR